jgi:hypothetical protein
MGAATELLVRLTFEHACARVRVLLPASLRLPDYLVQTSLGRATRDIARGWARKGLGHRNDISSHGLVSIAA